METMTCPNCGVDNRAGARFCAQCGVQLPETTPVAAASSESSETPPAGTRTSEGADQDVSPLEPDTLVSDEPNDASDDVPAGVDVVIEDEMSTVEAVPDDTSPAAALEPADADDEPGAEFAPLPAHTVLAERYEIIELVASEAQGNVYLARDLARCPICGFDENEPEDEYCSNCGAAIDPPPTCEIREQPEPAEPEAVARFTANARAYFVLPREVDDKSETTQPDSPPQVRLQWAAGTDPGQVRELNEDYVDGHVYSSQAGPALGLFVVADGVGGQAAGEVASQLASHVIWEQIRETVWLPEMQGEPVLPETIEARVVEAVEAANQAVYQERTERANDMGTTVTLALVRDTTAVIANVGDSRVYRWGAGGLEQLTVDHSLVQSLIDAGEAEPEAIYTHPQRNVIYRAVGERPRIEVDTVLTKLASGDRLILCSDGLWEMVRDDGIEEILLREPDPQMACEALVERANLAGGVDNISVIVVNLSGYPSAR